MGGKAIGVFVHGGDLCRGLLTLFRPSGDL